MDLKKLRERMEARDKKGESLLSARKKELDELKKRFRKLIMAAK